MSGPFEIGVVMSGAISAGAYSAGVMDFLFEALDAYYEARERPDWDGPTHDVKIPILAGASAGGMAAAMAALHTFRPLEHVSVAPAPAPASARNRLYSAWVKDIDIARLLETADLEGARRAGGVQSALCCDVLDEIVDDAFQIEGAYKARPWIGRVGDPTLRLRLTLTNLRGVPYSFQLFGANTRDRFGMLNHSEYFEFAVGSPDALASASLNGATSLDARNFDAAEWGQLKQAALATGAFPMGLKPRIIERADTSWFKKNGRVGYPGGEGEAAFVVVPPDEGFEETPYRFVAVDGGTIDNDPLELARRYLAGEGQSNKRDGVEASRAVLMISPFPSLPTLPPKDNTTTLLHVLPALMKTMQHQARFKLQELHLAADEKVFSRFMIAPARTGNHSLEAETYPIACGVLGGFGGFLHESFRRHDYLLGRRNTQAFLRWNFGLPEDNALFNQATFNRERWVVKSAEGRTGTLAPTMDASLDPKRFALTVTGAATQRGFPIIPLTEAMRAPIVIETIDCPTPDEVSLVQLRRLVEKRAKAVIGTLVDQDLLRHLVAPGLIDEAAKFGARLFGAHVAADMAMAQITAALKDVENAFLP